MTRLETLLLRDDTAQGDLERYSMFLVFSGNDDLYSKVDHFYDFENHEIIISSLDTATVDLSSSARKLVCLAFNLFNAYPCDVAELFTVLDSDNFSLAISAIKVRFGEE